MNGFGRKLTSNQLLFVAGWPAAGKSEFGKWLSDNKGFLHIDAEIENGIALDRLHIHSLWNECINTTNCERFAAALLEIGKPIIYNWGFPVHLLPVASALKLAGFSSWWFEADEEQSRLEFIRLNRSMGNFEIQVPAIKKFRSHIIEVFKPNIINTLDKSGNRLPREAIWAIIERKAP